MQLAHAVAKRDSSSSRRPSLSEVYRPQKASVNHTQALRAAATLASSHNAQLSDPRVRNTEAARRHQRPALTSASSSSSPLLRTKPAFSSDGGPAVMSLDALGRRLRSELRSLGSASPLRGKTQSGVLTAPSRRPGALEVPK